MRYTRIESTKFQNLGNLDHPGQNKDLAAVYAALVRERRRLRRRARTCGVLWRPGTAAKL